ncbi:MAG: hypothetical protein HXM00_03475 [[Eubacterium] sulci]|nr:hypothetical protein [[Eubacterium] sulci]
MGICDDSMLDSALNAPFQIFDDVALFPSIIEKAARLGFKKEDFCTHAKHPPI